MSGTVTPFSSQFFSPQVQPQGNIGQIQQALAQAQQRAALQQAQMQAMQQAQAKQQQAMLQASAIPGPATAPNYQPGQPLPLAGSQPMPVAGGGQGPMGPVQGAGMAAVQGQVPFSPNGVPTPALQRFRGAPGGRNAPGGANPFSIQAGGNQALLQAAIRDYAQQQNNPFGLNAAGNAANAGYGGYGQNNSTQDLQSAVAMLSKLGTLS